MTFRPLTESEIALARTMFGDAVDYREVKLADHKFWPLQSAKWVMAPMGHIHFHPRHRDWCGDFAASSIDAQSLFIHEMTHVWQSQTKGRLYLLFMRHPFCRYRYSVVAGRRFDDYGLEQQAEIIRHLFLARNGRSVPGMPPLQQLESIVGSARDPRLAAQAGSTA